MIRKFAVVTAVAALCIQPAAFAGKAEAQKWINNEFQPSTLSKAKQTKEMEWFIKAAAPFKGMEINVLSEPIPTHEYESKTLTKAFGEITGIKVNHQLLGEGEVVQAVQTQMQTKRNLYDAYINDSDLIGTQPFDGRAYPRNSSGWGLEESCIEQCPEGYRNGFKGGASADQRI